MKKTDLGQWIAEFLDAFAACGRGEREAASLLSYYGVPLLLTTDDGYSALTGEDEVVALAKQLLDGAGADYDHSEVLESEGTVLNSTSALYRAAYSRQRRDGGEINRLTVTYLVTEGLVGRRISALAVHSS
ncbi:MAG TPA: hypothetical protein VG674_28350 [Amycolatopsis sp.]|nr:hypothetical protein [Amycolatopsis sp.]